MHFGHLHHCKLEMVEDIVQAYVCNLQTLYACSPCFASDCRPEDACTYLRVLSADWHTDFPRHLMHGKAE